MQGLSTHPSDRFKQVGQGFRSVQELFRNKIRTKNFGILGPKIFTFLTSPTPRLNNRPKRRCPGRNMIARPFNTSIRPIEAGGTRISVRPGAFPPQNQDKEFWDFRSKKCAVIYLADSKAQQQTKTTLPRTEHDCKAFPYIHFTDSSRWDKKFVPSRSFSPIESGQRILGF